MSKKINWKAIAAITLSVQAGIGVAAGFSVKMKHEKEKVDLSQLITFTNLGSPDYNEIGTGKTYETLTDWVKEEILLLSGLDKDEIDLINFSFLNNNEFKVELSVSDSNPIIKNGNKYSGVVELTYGSTQNVTIPTQEISSLFSESQLGSPDYNEIGTGKKYSNLTDWVKAKLNIAGSKYEDLITVTIKDHVATISVDKNNPIIIGDTISVKYAGTTELNFGDTQNVTIPTQSISSFFDESQLGSPDYSEIGTGKKYSNLTDWVKAKLNIAGSKYEDLITVTVKDHTATISVDENNPIIIGDTISVKYAGTTELNFGDTQNVTIPTQSISSLFNESQLGSPDYNEIGTGKKYSNLTDWVKAKLNIAGSKYEDLITVTIKDHVATISVDKNNPIIIGDTISVKYAGTTELNFGDTQNVTIPTQSISSFFDESQLGSPDYSEIGTGKKYSNLTDWVKAKLNIAGSKYEDLITVTVKDHTATISVDENNPIIIGDTISVKYAGTTELNFGDTQNVTIPTQSISSLFNESQLGSPDYNEIGTGKTYETLTDWVKAKLKITGSKYEDLITVTIKDHVATISVDENNPITIGDTISVKYAGTVKLNFGNTQNVTIPTQEISSLFNESQLGSPDYSEIGTGKKYSNLTDWVKAKLNIAGSKYEDLITVTIKDHVATISVDENNPITIGDTISVKYAGTVKLNFGNTQNVTIPTQEISSLFNESQLGSPDYNEIGTGKTYETLTDWVKAKLKITGSKYEDLITVTIKDHTATISVDENNPITIGDTISVKYAGTTELNFGDTQNVTIPTQSISSLFNESQLGSPDYNEIGTGKKYSNLTDWVKAKLNITGSKYEDLITVIVKDQVVKISVDENNPIIIGDTISVKYAGTTELNFGDTQNVTIPTQNISSFFDESQLGSPYYSEIGTGKKYANLTDWVKAKLKITGSKYEDLITVTVKNHTATISVDENNPIVVGDTTPVKYAGTVELNFGDTIGVTDDLSNLIPSNNLGTIYEGDVLADGSINNDLIKQWVVKHLSNKYNINSESYNDWKELIICSDPILNNDGTYSIDITSTNDNPLVIAGVSYIGTVKMNFEIAKIKTNNVSIFQEQIQDVINSKKDSKWTVSDLQAAINEEFDNDYITVAEDTTKVETDGDYWTFTANNALIKNVDDNGHISYKRIDGSISLNSQVFQEAIYIDGNGKEVKTNNPGTFKYSNATKVIRIGYKEDDSVKGQIDAFIMPDTIKEIPSSLPKEITSLYVNKLSYEVNNSSSTISGGIFGSIKGDSLDLSNWDTSNITNMQGLFRNSDSLKTITGINNWNMSNVTNISYMFSGCHLLSSLDISNWNTSNITNMQALFSGAQKLKEITGISDIKMSNVTDISSMFTDCESLNSLDLSKWDVSNVKNMYATFSNAKLSSIDVTNWDTSNVTEMSYMFCSTELVKIDLSSFDTSKVTKMLYMFSSTSSLKEIEFGNNWITNNVEDVTGMFQACGNLSLDTTSWNFSSVKQHKDFNAGSNKVKSEWD